jgi:hypothetical protein
MPVPPRLADALRVAVLVAGWLRVAVVEGLETSP